jgi:hypothetical protein
MLANAKPSILEEKVPGNLRGNFLPKKIPNFFIQYESLVFDVMGEFCKEYSGGFWDFFTLSNGGFYMSLQSEKELSICIDSNYFEGKLSANAASIVVNLFVFCHLANSFPEDESLGDFYYALRDYSCNHPEAGQILSAID